MGNKQVAAAIKAHPELPREAVWVTTKVPCCPRHGNTQCITPEYNGSILQDATENNALLKVDYTDITLLHSPCDTLEETIGRYLELQVVLKKGLTKAIGVSNFNKSMLEAFAADPRITVTPAVNQCNHAIGNHNESHAPADGGDDATVAYCQSHGIQYSAYSPLEGLDGQDVFKLPEVVAIAKAHKASGAQIALKWLTQQNITV